MPAEAYKRTFVFRFWLCSHEPSLPRKEKIISRALAHPVGLLRQAALPASSLDCSQISSAAADEGYGSTLSQPAIFARRNTYFSAEDLSEMAWASVTNIESYLDYAPVGLPQQTAGFLQS